jgi:phosphohistidine phosphatase
MKELIIMRHAKSDWDNESLSDFERPLNERGNISAPLVAQELLERNFSPDKIFSSSATRAKETAKLVAKVFNIPAKSIEFDMRFYSGFKNDYFLYIQHLSNDINKAMIIGHNPNIENIIAILAKNKEKVTAMSTASAAYFQFDVNNWNEVMPNSGLLQFIIHPKEL